MIDMFSTWALLFFNCGEGRWDAKENKKGKLEIMKYDLADVFQYTAQWLLLQQGVVMCSRPLPLFHAIQICVLLTRRLTHSGDCHDPRASYFWMSYDCNARSFYMFICQCNLLTSMFDYINVISPMLMTKS